MPTYTRPTNWQHDYLEPDAGCEGILMIAAVSPEDLDHPHPGRWRCTRCGRTIFTRPHKHFYKVYASEEGPSGYPLAGTRAIDPATPVNSPRELYRLAGRYGLTCWLVEWGRMRRFPGTVLDWSPAQVAAAASALRQAVSEAATAETPAPATPPPPSSSTRSSSSSSTRSSSSAPATRQPTRRPARDPKPGCMR
jgi:hypothetical protein